MVLEEVTSSHCVFVSLLVAWQTLLPPVTLLKPQIDTLSEAVFSLVAKLNTCGSSSALKAETGVWCLSSYLILRGM